MRIPEDSLLLLQVERERDRWEPRARNTCSSADVAQQIHIRPFPSYCLVVISISFKLIDSRQTALLVYQEDRSQNLFEKKFFLEAGISLEAVG